MNKSKSLLKDHRATSEVLPYGFLNRKEPKDSKTALVEGSEKQSDEALEDEEP